MAKKKTTKRSKDRSNACKFLESTGEVSYSRQALAKCQIRKFTMGPNNTICQVCVLYTPTNTAVENLFDVEFVEEPDEIDFEYLSDDESEDYEAEIEGEEESDSDSGDDDDEEKPAKKKSKKKGKKKSSKVEEDEEEEVEEEEEEEEEAEEAEEEEEDDDDEEEDDESASLATKTWTRMRSWSRV